MVKLDLDLDPDPHSETLLDPDWDPDPYKVNADPQPGGGDEKCITFHDQKISF